MEQVYIGQVISDYCRQQEIPISYLASQIHLSPQSVYQYLKNNDLMVSRLFQISQALNYNFFAYYINPEGPDADPRSTLMAENNLLKAKIANQAKEILYLQEIVALYKANKS
jgi:transcriptional regulator with XRE-family HTH domain